MSSRHDTASIGALAAGLEAACSPDREFAIRVADYGVLLRTNAHDLADELQRYLSMFASPVDRLDARISVYDMPAPELDAPFFDWRRQAGKGLKERVADIAGGWLVHKVRTGMCFALGGEHRLAFGPCRANPNQVINFVNAQYIGWRMGQGWTLCHAAGVAAGGVGIGIAGVAGAGKSTLALHLMNRELDFVSNDRVLVRDDGGLAMTGVPKHPRINPGTALGNPRLQGILPAPRRLALQQLSAAELWDLEEKYDVDIGAFYDGRWSMVASLGGFVILNWQRDSSDPPRMRAIDFIDRRDLWPAVMKHPGPLGLSARGRPDNTWEADPELYLALFARVPVYEITGGVDFDRAADLCMGLLG